MRRGWEVELDDGTILQEASIAWGKVPKKRIVRLTLKYDGREWNLHNKDVYLQKKRGSMVPFLDSSFQIESRSIGYYEDSTKVWYTLNEHTGKMKMEVEDN